AARRQESGLRAARLLRSVDAGPRAEQLAPVVGGLGTVERRALGAVRAALPRRDARAGGAAPARAPRRAVEADQLQRRLLLRRRVAVPPVRVARDPGRGGGRRPAGRARGGPS